MEGKRILSMRIGSLLLITDKILSKHLSKARASSHLARRTMPSTSDLGTLNNNNPVTNKSGTT